MLKFGSRSYSDSNVLILICVQLATRKVYNRKTGEMEDRQCVWVQTAMSREKYEEEANQRSVQLKQISKDPSEAQIKEASMRVASFVSHDCESDFLSSAKLYDFQDDWTNFTDVGGPNCTAAKARRKGNNKAKGNTKLVDVTQLRTKFTVKISTVAKTAGTYLKEAHAFFEKYQESEKELFDKFNSVLENDTKFLFFGASANRGPGTRADSGG